MIVHNYEFIRIPASVRADLKALEATVDMHEQNKANLQDKLANPLLSDSKCLGQYRSLLAQTIAMIELLNKEIRILINQL